MAQQEKEETWEESWPGGGQEAGPRAPSLSGPMLLWAAGTSQPPAPCTGSAAHKGAGVVSAWVRDRRDVLEVWSRS